MSRGGQVDRPSEDESIPLQRQSRALNQLESANDGPRNAAFVSEGFQYVFSTNYRLIPAGTDDSEPRAAS